MKKRILNFLFSFLFVVPLFSFSSCQKQEIIRIVCKNKTFEKESLYREHLQFYYKNAIMNTYLNDLEKVSYFTYNYSFPLKEETLYGFDCFNFSTYPELFDYLNSLNAEYQWGIIPYDYSELSPIAYSGYIQKEIYCKKTIKKEKSLKLEVERNSSFYLISYQRPFIEDNSYSLRSYTEAIPLSEMEYIEYSS